MIANNNNDVSEVTLSTDDPTGTIRRGHAKNPDKSSVVGRRFMNQGSAYAGHNVRILGMTPSSGSVTPSMPAAFAGAWN